MQAVMTGYLPERRTGAKRSAGFASPYTRGEEIFNAVSHIVGGALGVVICIIGILFAYPSAVSVTAVTIFAVSVIILYTMSSLYHFLPDGRAKGVFRIFDHCTIYLLIAGTYTPYCMVALAGTTLGTVVLVAEWACAIAGITMNAIAMNNKSVKAVSMVLYVAMGWMIAIGMKSLLSVLSPASFWLLLSGGIVYTVGIVFYALGKRVRYFHCVWHLFDLAGTVLQFLSILLLL